MTIASTPKYPFQMADVLSWGQPMDATPSIMVEWSQCQGGTHEHPRRIHKQKIS